MTDIMILLIIIISAIFCISSFFKLFLMIIFNFTLKKPLTNKQIFILLFTKIDNWEDKIDKYNLGGE